MIAVVDSLMPGVAGAVGAMLVMAWLLARRRGEAGTVGDRRVVEYGGAWRGLVTVLCLAPAVVLILAAAVPPKPEEAWIPWVLAGAFAALAAPLALETFAKRVLVDAAGVESRSPWTGRRAFAWPELAAVEYNAAMQWYVLRSRGGVVIRVNVYMSGLSTLAEKIRAHAPSGVDLGALDRPA